MTRVEGVFHDVDHLQPAGRSAGSRRAGGGLAPPGSGLRNRPESTAKSRKGMFMMAIETLVLRRAPQEVSPSGGSEADFPEHEVFALARQTMRVFGPVIMRTRSKSRAADTMARTPSSDRKGKPRTRSLSRGGGPLAFAVSAVPSSVPCAAAFRRGPLRGAPPRGGRGRRLLWLVSGLFSPFSRKGSPLQRR